MLKPPLDPDEAAAHGDIIEDLPLREPEERRNIGSNLRRIVRLIDVVRVDKEGFRHAADGEFLAIAIKDRAAQGLDAKLIAALVTHALCERIALNDLQIGIAKRQHNDADKHEQGNACNASLHRCPKILHCFARPPSNRSRVIIPEIYMKKKAAAASIRRGGLLSKRKNQ